MAEKDPERLKPAADLLANSANQGASDRAKRISSLHNQVNGLLQDESKKRRQVGSEVGSIVRQQQSLKKQLQVERDEIGADVASGYGKVVNNLGNTIKQLSIGMKNISMSTAKASADAVTQYSKAIGQDIHINKTNTIAMALSRATPLFGYFAAKFMETDVFRGAISKIRQGVGGAMLAGLRGAGSAISNIFRGKSTAEKVAGRERELGALSSEVASLKKELQAKPPSLQVGGYVKKGGVVQVHAAEVIAPVDTLVKQIVETTNKQQQKQQKTFFKTFIKEFRHAKSPQEQAWQDRMLKAILELKVAFIGTTSRLRIAWQKTLLENPAFRGMLMFAEGFKAVLGAPIKWLFGARGMYLSDVKKATSTDNVFLKISNLLGLIYTVAMPKLDAIASYTRIAARELSGVEPKEPIPTRYSMYQKIRGYIDRKKKGKKGKPGAVSGAVSDWFLEKMGLEDKSERAEFRKAGGVKGIFGLAKEVKDLGGPKLKGLSEKGKELASNQLFDLEVKRRAMAKQLKHKGGMAGLGKEAYAGLKKLTQDIRELKDLKKKQEEREKPHSPSWVQFIGMTFGKTKERVIQANKEYQVTDKMSKGISSMKGNVKKHADSVKSRGEKQFQEIKKNRKASVEANTKLGKMQRGIKKLGNTGWKILMFAFTMFQNIINTGVSAIGNIFGPILNMLGLRWMFKGRKNKMSMGRRWKEQKVKARRTGRKGKKFGKTAARLKSRFGKKTAAKFVAKRGAGMLARGALAGGKVAAGIGGGLLGGVLGVGMGLWDAGKAVLTNPEGFVGGAIVRGLSAFIGGTETGSAGAISGAMKWGGIGAAIGLPFGGPLGAAIGGAIGAVGGAILGFVGGAKLSKAMSGFFGGLKKFALGIWNVVTFLPRAIWEGVQFIKMYFTETIGGKAMWKKIKWIAKELVLLPVLPFRLASGLSKRLKKWIGEQWQILKDKYLGSDTWFGRAFTWVHDFMGAIGKFFTDVRDGIYKWFNKTIQKIKDIPFIGSFIKGIKEIQAGTFAEKRIAEIKSSEHFGKVGAYEAGGVKRPFEAQRIRGTSKAQSQAAIQSAKYAREILGAEEIRFKNGIADLAKVGGKWYKLKIDNSGLPKEISRTSGEGDLAGTHAKKELSKRKATEAELAALGETISDKMDTTSGKSNNIAMNSTTMLTNTISSSNNTATGGGGGGASTQNPWGSGAGASLDVSTSNIN